MKMASLSITGETGTSHKLVVSSCVPPTNAYKVPTACCTTCSWCTPHQNCCFFHVGDIVFVLPVFLTALVEELPLPSLQQPPHPSYLYFLFLYLNLTLQFAF